MRSSRSWLLAHLVGPASAVSWLAVWRREYDLEGQSWRAKTAFNERRSRLRPNLRGFAVSVGRLSPGRIESSVGSRSTSSRRTQTREPSAGFDLAVVDELGLLKERDRDLIASMRSSVSARDGKLCLHLSRVRLVHRLSLKFSSGAGIVGSWPCILYPSVGEKHGVR